MNKKRFFLIILVAALLGLVLIYAGFEFFYTGSGSVYIDVTPDKSFYLQGEEVRFNIFLDNQRDRPIPYPENVSYYIEELDYYIYSGPSAPPPPGSSSIPPDHKTFYYTQVWNQEVEGNGNQTQVLPGNYTITVSFKGSIDFGAGTNCTIEILQIQ